MKFHCENEWKWSGIVPLHEKHYRYCGDILPLSSNTLGDGSEKAKVQKWGFLDSLPYLLSTDAHDKQIWRVNVSLVSPCCSETLIDSIELVPSKVITCVEEWEVANPELGNDPDSVRHRSVRRSALNQKLFKFSAPIVDQGTTYGAGRPNCIAFLDESNRIQSNYEDSYRLFFDFFWDRRDSQIEKFHAMFHLDCGSNQVLENMLVRAPPQMQMTQK